VVGSAGEFGVEFCAQFWNQSGETSGGNCQEQEMVRIVPKAGGLGVKWVT